jgi:hypothetical protein
VSGFDVWCSGVDKGARVCRMIVGRRARSKSYDAYRKGAYKAFVLYRLLCIEFVVEERDRGGGAMINNEPSRESFECEGML